MKKYFPKDIEKKWQENWKKQGIYKFSKNPKNKYYNLVELPYPSGDLHIGHWFSFVPPDAHARYKRMSGFDVFFPNGFDAFGLPAENAAIKHGAHPKDWTMKNIEAMTKQFQTMGTMIDWDYTVITCLPEFYKWNQVIFLEMFKKGIAYRGKALSNWCPKDQTVLANEHIEAGRCWRCGTEVIQKEIEQWFLRITKYADDLIWKQPPQADWPKQVREGQNNWIGKSDGLLINFGGIEVFTTRPETADGATFLVIAPEHQFAKDIKSKEVEEYIKLSQKKTEMERKEDRTKSGVFTGLHVRNPVTGKDIPVWISDYVLAGYGTGAIMAVPFADERDREFAEKFNLPIQETSFKAKPSGEKMVNYHLRDWSISRQRYWGTPVPIIHCKKCGMVPVPEADLPIELPYNVDYAPKGKPPLASDEEWLNVKCPNCSGPAKRDAETLDTFFDSSWYYYRFVTPKYDKGPFNHEVVNKIMPVDVYFGGGEHTLGHTLYARFFTKFFKDMGVVKFDEFAKKRVQHGVILGTDGNRMSKSRGNVVNPDDVVSEYGADTVRLYLCFMMPYEATSPWSTGAISGIYRFLNRVWDLSEKVSKVELSQKDFLQMHKTIKKVGEDLNNFQFNTAVANLMGWINYLSSKDKISQEEYSTFLKLLAPFAPHITEELYQSEDKSAKSIHLEKWPEYQSKYLAEEEAEIAVQINGKLRGSVKVESSKIDQQTFIEKEAKSDEKISKYLRDLNIKKVIYVKGKILNFVV